MTSRRGFLFGIGAALAAPAVVRADTLMKLWVPKPAIIVPSNSMLTLSELTMLEWEAMRRTLLVEGLWRKEMLISGGMVDAAYA